MKDQWIEWLQDKQRHFFYGVVAVVALFFAAFQLVDMVHKKKRTTHFAAMQTFEGWLLRGEAFEKLQASLQKNPELETKFGARIADRFIASGQGAEAEPFVSSVLGRVKEETPMHAAYAKGSLLIAKGDLSGALKQSIALKNSLSEDSLLYGFTLVRIASLYRGLDAQSKEQEALQGLETYMGTHPHEARILSDCFQSADATLTDYIHHRKAL